MNKYAFFRTVLDEIEGTNIEIRAERFIAIIEADDFIKACKIADDYKLGWSRWESLEQSILEPQIWLL